MITCWRFNSFKSISVETKKINHFKPINIFLPFSRDWIKLCSWVKIAQVIWRPYINRAAQLQTQTKDEHLQIIYKVCQGRLLDFKHKFIEAASRYNELSYKTVIHEDERMTALKNAMICTILASAGQHGSRMLATLYKDERCQQLPGIGTNSAFFRTERSLSLLLLDLLTTDHDILFLAGFL